MAGLISGDNQRGFALARRIDAGAVHVNDQSIADEPQLPLGARAPLCDFMYFSAVFALPPEAPEVPVPDNDVSGGAT